MGLNIGKGRTHNIPKSFHCISTVGKWSILLWEIIQGKYVRRIWPSLFAVLILWEKPVLDCGVCYRESALQNMTKSFPTLTLWRKCNP
jgi:hypothetical protein